MSDLKLIYSGNYLVVQMRGTVGKYHGVCFLSSPSNGSTPYGQLPFWFKQRSVNGAYSISIQCYSMLNFVQDAQNFFYNCYQLLFFDWEIIKNQDSYTTENFLVGSEYKITGSNYNFKCEPGKIFILDTASAAYQGFIESSELDSLAFRMFSSLKPNSFSSFIS